jgi:hypothetical protein
MEGDEGKDKAGAEATDHKFFRHTNAPTLVWLASYSLFTRRIIYLWQRVTDKPASQQDPNILTGRASRALMQH